MSEAGGGQGKRLNKRQLREQQELEALILQKKEQAHPAEDAEQDDDEDEADGEAAVEAGGGLFAQLANGGGDSDNISDDEGQDDAANVSVAKSSKSKNKKKKKKKGGVSAAKEDPADDEGKVTHDSEKQTEQVESSQTTPAAPQLSKSAKRKKAKKGASNPAPSASASKDDKNKDVSNMSMDEFSALLETQAQIDQRKQANAGEDAVTITPIGPLSSLRSHLALAAPALDPAVELKRQFGAAAIKAYESENGEQGSGASAGARARAQAWNPNFKVRNILVQPKDTWPPIARTFTGMTMDVFEVEDRGKIGGWEHSRAYRKAQFNFLQAVQSYEPNHLMGLLRMYPWHIDTLLQLSDVSRHQGDLGQASDFNARALFAFERTAAPIFTSSLTSHLGPPMLNFNRIEDRGFWLAAHRNVNFLGRRGTWRTALEWVKLILGLDPTNDHHGMLLWLDFLSIKSRQHAWFLSYLQKMESAIAAELEHEGVPILNAKTPFDDEKTLIGEGATCRGTLDWYVGLAYAKALSLRATEKESAAGETKPNGNGPGASTAALRLAIARHPHVIPPLLEKIGVPWPVGVPSSHAVWTSDAEEDQMPEILRHIYIARSESLWREPGVSQWLTKTLKEMWPTLEKGHERGELNQATATPWRARESIYRHILVSDLPDALRQKLVGLMPKLITQDSSMLNAFDPLPPQGEEATSYDDAYFALARSRRSAGGEDDEYIDMDAPAAAGLMDRLMQALRGVRGMEGWGAAMQDMDDETRQDVMAQMMQMAADAQQAVDGGEHMPGALQGAVEGEDDEAQEQDGQERRPGSEASSFNAIRGLLDRMWGARQEESGNNDDDDEDEEEIEELEPEGGRQG